MDLKKWSEAAAVAVLVPAGYEKFADRGTENDLIVITSKGVQDCEVTPPGQSGFIAPEGTKAKHYQDQLEMYGKFGCKPTWLNVRDVDRNLESKIVLHY